MDRVGCGIDRDLHGVCTPSKPVYPLPDTLLLSNKNPASLRMVRPEQKAPLVLAPLRVSNPALASRKPASGTFRHFEHSPLSGMR